MEDALLEPDEYLHTKAYKKHKEGRASKRHNRRHAKQTANLAATAARSGASTVGLVFWFGLQRR